LLVIEREAPVKEAAAPMSRPHTGLVVVCDHGAVVGVLTKTDIVGQISRYMGSGCTAKVDSIMFHGDHLYAFLRFPKIPRRSHRHAARRLPVRPQLGITPDGREQSQTIFRAGISWSTSSISRVAVGPVTALSSRKGKHQGPDTLAAAVPARAMSVVSGHFYERFSISRFHLENELTNCVVETTSTWYGPFPSIW
jgi:hypothetical protein